MQIWNGFPGEKYHVLGNHDLDKYSKEEFTKRIWYAWTCIIPLIKGIFILLF